MSRIALCSYCIILCILICSACYYCMVCCGMVSQHRVAQCSAISELVSFIWYFWCFPFCELFLFEQIWVYVHIIYVPSPIITALVAVQQLFRQVIKRARELLSPDAGKPTSRWSLKMLMVEFRTNALIFSLPTRDQLLNGPLLLFQRIGAYSQFFFGVFKLLRIFFRHLCHICAQMCQYLRGYSVGRLAAVSHRSKAHSTLFALQAENCADNLRAELALVRESQVRGSLRINGTLESGYFQVLFI